MLHTRDLARQADFWSWTTEKEFVSVCMAGSLVLVLQLQSYPGCSGLFSLWNERAGMLMPPLPPVLPVILCWQIIL